MPEEPEDSDHSDDLNDPPAFFPYGENDPEETQFCKMEVQGVFSVEGEDLSREIVVLLAHEEFQLPIKIGPFEAQAISLPLENSQPDRPLTHDLIKTMLDRLGWELELVQIDDLFNGVYYAKVYLKKGSETIKIDSRPSDAIALAVRMGAPVTVAMDLLEEEE